MIYKHIFSPRAWCSFCPMGTLAEITDRFGEIVGPDGFNQKVKIIDTEKCEECGTCTKACPLDLEPYKKLNEMNEFDNRQCMKCGKCIESCPLNIMELHQSNKKSESVGPCLFDITGARFFDLEIKCYFDVNQAGVENLNIKNLFNFIQTINFKYIISDFC